MQRTLVLNATYEPLGVIPLRRAVILVFREKAELVEAHEGMTVRSAKLELPVPAVIRLTRYIRVPYRSSAPLSRKTVLFRDQQKCGYCGKRATTIDHILPRSRGGKHIWENLVAACQKCNEKKADRTPEEANMRLLVDPHIPAGTTALIVAVGVLEKPWKQYLLS